MSKGVFHCLGIKFYICKRKIMLFLLSNATSSHFKHIYDIKYPKCPYVPRIHIQILQFQKKQKSSAWPNQAPWCSLIWQSSPTHEQVICHSSHATPSLTFHRDQTELTMGPCTVTTLSTEYPWNTSQLTQTPSHCAFNGQFKLLVTAQMCGPDLMYNFRKKNKYVCVFSCFIDRHSWRRRILCCE